MSPSQGKKMCVCPIFVSLRRTLQEMNEGLCSKKPMGNSLKEAVPQFMFSQLHVELRGFFLNCWRILKAPYLLVHEKFITHINMKD